MIRTAIAALVTTLLIIGGPTGAQSVATTPTLQDAARIETIARLRASVVEIRSFRRPAAASSENRALDEIRAMFGAAPGKPQGGSGFVVDSAGALVATAAHIVADAERIVVADAAGKTYPAELALHVPARGLAVLRVRGLAPPAVALANRQPAAGESLVGVGWMLPARALLALDAMVMGNLSVDAKSAGNAPSGPYVALSAPLPGGSFGGSPVADSTGKVVGFVTATFGQLSPAGSVTLMLPIAPLQPLIEQQMSARPTN